MDVGVVLDAAKEGISPRMRGLWSVLYFDMRRCMDDIEALLAFSALSQSTRLDVFRLLMANEPAGLPAGEVARRLAVPQNTMSTHLAVLTRAGLIVAERRSRSIIYRARIDGVRALVDFLMHDCCGGNPQVCAVLAPAGSPTCADEPRCAEEASHG